jgi:hypothetical protein
MLDNPMIKTVLRFSSCFVAAALAVASSTQAQIHFSPEERSQIIEYWSAAGRYQHGMLPDSLENGTWRARQTVEGSQWIWGFQRALRPGKPNPLGEKSVPGTRMAQWDAWIDRRIAYDFDRAERDAAAKNSAETGKTFSVPGSPLLPPGPPPAALLEVNGEPPVFAAAVQPRSHKITFDDGVELSYTDTIPLRRKFAYYRFNEGVMSVGERVKELSDRELSSLFSDAGLSRAEMSIMKSVSLLEGGFDSINTYDTGYVSAGFIQFAALEGGAGSLGAVLLDMKKNSYAEFNQEFRRFGLEVTSAGQLVALCASSGAEFIGSQAALKVISDRRLASVFQRAGRVSRAYRVSQLRVAKAQYYPADDVIRVARGGRYESVRVRDIFRTEAGLATLMDRKVNTGSLGRLSEIVQLAAERTQVEDLSDLAQYEYDLVREMRWRKDYLADSSLSRPKDPTAEGGPGRTRPGSVTGSRGSTRQSRQASSAKAQSSRSASLGAGAKRTASKSLAKTRTKGTAKTASSAKGSKILLRKPAARVASKRS